MRPRHNLLIGAIFASVFGVLAATGALLEQRLEAQNGGGLRCDL